MKDVCGKDGRVEGRVERVEDVWGMGWDVKWR